MGNDNSKSEVENQQLIMQLQTQLEQQKQLEHQKRIQVEKLHLSQNTRNIKPSPIISPAELQRGINPHVRQQEQMQSQMQSQISNTSSANKLLDILGNKALMTKIDKNPSQKRKLLEKLINNHKHMMTSNQVTRITQMLNNLPPENNNEATKYAFQNIYENHNTNQNNHNKHPLHFSWYTPSHQRVDPTPFVHNRLSNCVKDNQRTSYSLW